MLIARGHRGAVGCWPRAPRAPKLVSNSRLSRIWKPGAVLFGLASDRALLRGFAPTHPNGDPDVRLQKKRQQLVRTWLSNMPASRCRNADVRIGQTPPCRYAIERADNGACSRLAGPRSSLAGLFAHDGSLLCPRAAACANPFADRGGHLGISARFRATQAAWCHCADDTRAGRDRSTSPPWLPV